MNRAIYTASLTHSRHDAWSFIGDLSNDPIWRREITRSELIAGEMYQVGATYHEHVAWEGVSAETNLKVEEVEPDSLVVVVAEDPGYRSIARWQFADAAEGSIVSLDFSLETSGALRLAEPFLWAIFNRWLERDLETLDEKISLMQS